MAPRSAHIKTLNSITPRSKSYLQRSQNFKKSLLSYAINGKSNSSALNEVTIRNKPETVIARGTEGDEVEDFEEEEEEEIQDVLEQAKDRKKRKEYGVFVGGLDRYAVEEDLERAFQKLGDVVEVRLVKKAHSQENKGFAFVRFATVEQARRAVTQIKVVKVNGRDCGILKNNGNETLHLRNVCTTWTKDKLMEKLKDSKFDNLEEVHLIDDPNSIGKNRGYAFLEFCTHMDAVAACITLQKRDIFFGTNVKGEAAFSKSAVGPDEEVMAQVKSVFLDGLPATWDEIRVCEKFEKYGEIENVQLARNMPTARRKDFGFIWFKTREAALACIDDVNKKGVQLKATLKRPLVKRGKSVMAARGGNFVGRGHDDRRPRLHRVKYSYSSTATKTHGTSVGNLVDSGPYSFRGLTMRIESPPEWYGGQLRREGVREESAPVMARSSRRDPYIESSSSGCHAFDDYEEYPTTFSRVPSHRSHDDSYSSRHGYYDDQPVDAYDYVSYSGLKRPYLALDEDMVASSSLRRRNASSYEVDAHAHPSVSFYDEYSRVSPDFEGYYREAYYSKHYESPYTSAKASSRSYY